MSRKTHGRRPDPAGREVRQAALARDAARGRLRRLTQVSIAAAVALGGAFAALAAGSTHTKKVVRVPVAVAPRTASAAVLVQAPAPPLVDAQSAAPQPEAPASSSAPSAPAAAPAPAYAPPVVVSGGS